MRSSSVSDVQNDALFKLGAVFGRGLHPNVPVAVFQLERGNIGLPVIFERRLDVVTHMRRAAKDRVQGAFAVARDLAAKARAVERA